MKLRIVCIADTHGFHQEMSHPIPDGDILIHAGDCCKYGTISDLQLYNDWIGQFPHPFKVTVAGNHDLCFEKDGPFASEQLTNTIYLENSSVEIDGIQIYGSPVQPEFLGWSFNFSPERREFYWKQIPENTDILITHCPSFGVLDMTVRGEAVGCKMLEKRLTELNVKLHILGHIHWSYGTTVVNGCTHVNASTCGEDYVPKNKPVVVDWNDGEVEIIE